MWQVVVNRLQTQNRCFTIYWLWRQHVATRRLSGTQVVAETHSWTLADGTLNQEGYHLFHAALRPRRRDGLLGTGTEWEGDERVKARPRIPPEKDRRDRGPPPEQWKCQVKAVSLRHCPATCALRNCCFNCCAWTVTKTMSVALLLMNNLDNSKQKEVQLAQRILRTPPYFRGITLPASAKHHSNSTSNNGNIIY